MPLEVLQSGLREPWAQCETVRADLLAVLGKAGASHWNTKPGPGRWSVAQQADHLLRAEIGTSKVVRRLIRGDFQELAMPDGAELYDSTLAAYPFGPATAPAVLEPQSLAAHEAMDHLAAAHGRFLEELQRFRGEDPDALLAPDPNSYLWFTLAGWVCVQALHEAHHVGQIKDSVITGQE